MSQEGARITSRSNRPRLRTAPGRRPAATEGGLGCAVEVIGTLVLTLVIFLLVQNFVAQPFQVQGSSMERTFVESDYVLVDRLTPRWSPYARGQVVVFQAPPR